MRKSAYLGAAITLAASSLSVVADEVRLKDGTVVKGVVAGVEGGVLSITPGYNADGSVKAFKFKLADITSFYTEEPLYVGTSATDTPIPDNVSFGKVEGAPGGIKVVTENGTTTAPIEAIRAAWRTPAESPQEKERKKLERHWEYEFTTDIVGKSGNSDSIGASVGFKAVNKSIHDELTFFGRYNYYRTDGVQSQEDLDAGVEYKSEFANPLFWYVSSHNGFDKVKLIDFMSVSAVGGGTKLIDQANQKLDVRLGLAYRYESYEDGTDMSKPGLDIGYDYSLSWSWGKFVDKLTYTPVFDDFGNYLLKHQAYLEMPIASSENWMIRLGMSNDYNSRPLPTVDRLDTTYFVRIVLKFR
ncbi:MAG: DUF481 domain-containing protein [Puniceicoccales bacterium]|jgi:hypothetical protein|nr:DUF481 domain-containing protein [Puniceicoccales bacterium]